MTSFLILVYMYDSEYHFITYEKGYSGNFRDVDLGYNLLPRQFNGQTSVATLTKARVSTKSFVK
jgi:hypothetical protein